MAKNLLICRILSSLLYVLMNILAPTLILGWRMPSKAMQISWKTYQWDYCLFFPAVYF
jgi:hypothetical protein